jgi:hypothetical protein
MKTVFISPDLYPMVLHIKNVLDKTYKNTLNWSSAVTNALRHPYIIIQVDKSEDCDIFLPFPKEIEYFRNIRIIETHENFYMSIPMDIAIKFMYEDEKPYYALSEKLKEDISTHIPNLLNKNEFDRWVNKHKLEDILERTKKYIFLINDSKYLNKEYLNLISQCQDLTKEDINRLFRVTIRFLNPVNKVLKLARNNDIIIDYNDCDDSFDTLLNDRLDLTIKNDIDISSFLSRLSNKDIYTDRNVSIEITTSINKLISFIHENIRSYGLTNPDFIDILPISTLVDTFITVDLETLKLLATKSKEFDDAMDLVCYRNNVMSFAVKDMTRHDI